MFSFRNDPLADPVVVAWDAWVAGDSSAGSRISEPTTTMIEALAAAMPIVEPDADFLASLERKLLRSGSQSLTAVAAPVGPVVRPTPLSEPTVHHRFTEAWQPGRWAIASLLAICLVGTAVLVWSKRDDSPEPRHIPAAVDDARVAATPDSSPMLNSYAESILDIVVAPADLGGGSPTMWDSVEFAEVHVQPGESFTTEAPYFSCCDGIAVYQVQEGSLRLTVAGPTDVYRGEGIAAERVEANTTILIGPGESAAFALKYVATVENAGTEVLEFIGGYVAASEEIKAFVSPGPNGYHPQYVAFDYSMTKLDGESVEISFDRITLPPGGAHNLDVSAGDRRIGWHEGFSNSPQWFAGNLRSEPKDVDGTKISTFVLGLLTPGPYTVFNPYDEDINFYLMDVTETDDASTVTEQTETASPVASPVAAVKPAETILDIQVNPGDLGAATSELWDTMEFEMVYVDAGASFNTDHPYFTCCAGVNVFQVLEGSASFLVESDADVYAAGEWSAPTRFPAGTLFSLGEGETVVHVMNQPAIVTNTGPGELVLLRGSGEQFVGPVTSQMPAGYRGRAWATDSNMEPLPGETVNVSFERIALEPGDITHVEAMDGVSLNGFYPETADTWLRMLPGAFDAIPADAQSFVTTSIVMGNFAPGPYTFFNAGDDPATFYLMRIEGVAPVSPASTPVGVDTETASPVAAVQAAETILDIQVNPGELGATTSDLWDAMEFALVRVQPGESFNTDHPYFTCCPGMAVFQVREGRASFVVDGPADFYEAGPAQPPTRIPAGTLFALEAGQAAVFAMESLAVVTNTGSADLTMLGGYAYDFVGPASHQLPDGYRNTPATFKWDLDPIPADLLDVSFEQITLDPGEMTHIESRAEEWIGGWFPETNTSVKGVLGEFDAFPAGSAGTFIVANVIGFYSPGDYTFSNAGDYPATFHIMRIAPVTAATETASPVASPVVEVQAAETILDIQVNPGDLGATTPDLWDTMEFALVHVQPGESFNTDHPYFTCCAGVAVFQVLDGSASFIVDSDAEVYTADTGQEPVRVSAGSLFALESGDTAVFVMDQPAIVTNTGTDELLMLGAYGYQFLGPITSVTPDGYLDVPWVAASSMDPLPGNEVRVQLERIALEPGELTHIESSPDFRLVGWYPETNTMVRMAMGALDAVPDDPFATSMVQSFVMTNFSEGPYTFFNTGNNTATLYVMRIKAVAPDSVASSPVAVDSAELPFDVDRDGWNSLLNAVVRTSPYDFESGPAQHSAYFTETSLAPSRSGVDVGCCNGVHVMTVLEGEIAITSLPNPIQSFVRGGVDRDLSVLQEGESIIFAGTMTVANESGKGARFMIGGVYPADTSTADTISLMSIDIDQVTLQPGDSVPFTVTPNDVLRLMANQEGGVMLIAASGYTWEVWSGLNTANLESGDYQMKNSSSQPITVQVLRIGPDLAPPSS